MNHGEWGKKIKDIEDRLKKMKGLDRLGPVQLCEMEKMIDALEDFLAVRL